MERRRSLPAALERRVIRAGPMLVDRGHFLGREPGWHDDLEHLDVIAVRNLAVTNRGRLMHAGTRIEPDDTLSLVLELDPAFEHVHELDCRAVQMRRTRECRPGHRADDTSHRGAARRPFHPER